MYVVCVCICMWNTHVHMHVEVRDWHCLQLLPTTLFKIRSLVVHQLAKMAGQ